MKWYKAAAHCMSAACAALLFIFSSCGVSSDEAQEIKYGSDAYYFKGLTALRDGEQEDALELFKTGTVESSLFFSRLCMQQLLRLVPAEEQLVLAEKYQDTWHDIDALSVLTRLYYDAAEYERIIDLTEQTAAVLPDELVKYRLLALAQLQEPAFYEEALRWFSTRSYSEQHLQFYTEFQKLPLSDKTDPENNIVVLNRLSVLMDMRTELYRREYHKAYNSLRRITASFGKMEDALVQLPVQLLSDAGKILLYGSTDYVKNALAFDKADALAKTDEQLFYLRFYAGRLYDRSGSKNIWLAADRFEQALICAPEPENADNALWYYLSVLLKAGAEETVAALEQYGTAIHDPYYFTDFFDTLSLSLAAKRDWQSFYHTYMLIRGGTVYADAQTVSKYAYITGRVLEEGLYIPQGGSEDIPAAVKAAYTDACIPGGNLYYSIAAGSRLGLADREICRIVLDIPLDTDFQINADAEKLLTGLCDFELYGHIYTAWQHFRSQISMDTALRLAHTLRDLYAEDSLSRSNALRIISYVASHPEKPLSEALLVELYPRNFSEYIVPLCDRFGLPPSYMYALVRSESFFDPHIISYAGAEGLTQLMAPTAQDIANKLGIAEYSLQDPETNLLFGTFYLEEMISRLDGSPVLGLCAYNAGITRVRRWQADAADLPVDLMVETIPFLETRGYVQKTVSAAVMYALLYDNVSSQDTLAAMLR